MLLQHNVPLNDKNWFKTGGSARFFAEPTTPQELIEAVTYAQTHALPIFFLGTGANILISDEGFDGLVIRPALSSITAHESKNGDASVFVTAGAGATMPDLIEWCLNHQILGVEEFSGIPGTVGGSVYINLHYYSFLLSHFLQSATVLHLSTGVIERVDNGWFQFGYNESRLLSKEHVLVDATFALRQATELETAYARGRRVEIIRHRTARYPSTNTCGSFFRNFLPDEVSLTIAGKKMIYVAYYLDKIGVKGALSVGDAHVSYQHANMLVTGPHATSTDVIQLARLMQEKVRDAFGIIPQPECQLVGFSEYPLL